MSTNIRKFCITRRQVADIMIVSAKVVYKGGKGSGNFGHAGRPGKRGGSASSSSGMATEKDVEASLALASICRVEKKMCWKNSVMAMGLLDGSEYVEGYYAVDIGDFKFPIEHGWLQSEGKVIDVTLPEDKGTYFPAKKYSYKQVQDIIFDSSDPSGVTLPFIKPNDSDLINARTAANKEAFGIDI